MSKLKKAMKELKFEEIPQRIVLSAEYGADDFEEPEEPEVRPPRTKRPPTRGTYERIQEKNKPEREKRMTKIYGIFKNGKLYQGGLTQHDARIIIKMMKKENPALKLRIGNVYDEMMNK